MLRRKEARHARRTLGDYDNLPTTSFDGPIAVIHSELEEQPHAEYLREQKVVGVDTEARPDFQPLKGKKGNPVCLIQVSTLDRAFIYRLQRGKPLPPVLQELFADPGVLKVGHSLSDDFRQLKAADLVNTVNSTRGADQLRGYRRVGAVESPARYDSAEGYKGALTDQKLQLVRPDARERGS
ncbi:hypothetical protein PHYSODRAFT_472255 [Phytophthora sojae]|uniref:3'-5' exonuclease domain-containing protein n=1 Tax=Phytophthora sojae (strain P6497) TaxID=1094619 RepID=G4YQ68_PHYSP|nr:hypothetical protein PHYSODRAFT_472255 [Phytophthora sojae]EGZ29572.1 hypothetical protein PHYSODRAFT_472255 [Phytophthora sojae]|eukprot:XP_009516847.1 hypothetical protein PHYSODRAFT_472255 [Phytophthora sojae]